jgi:hypothetical protein
VTPKGEGVMTLAKSVNAYTPYDNDKKLTILNIWQLEWQIP